MKDGWQYQQLTERHEMDSLLEPSKRACFCLDFRLFYLLIVGKLFVVLRHAVCGTCYHSPGKLKHFVNPLLHLTIITKNLQTCQKTHAFFYHCSLKFIAREIFWKILSSHSTHHILA